MQRDAFEGETYLEAIPITAILTFIYLSAIWSDDGITEPPILSLIGSDAKFFFVSYATSLLTASFGLAKALKTGPCRILPEGRLLSCRFLLLIFATLLTLAGKLSLVLLFITLHFLEEDRGILLAFILSFAVVLLPGLVTALVSTWHSKMLKTFLIHPSFFILPIFTYLTFSSSRKGGMGVCHLRFSVKASLCNTFLSFLAFATFILITLAVQDNPSEPTEDWGAAIIWFTLLLPGFLLSLLFLCLAKPTSKRFTLCCCCSSTCCSNEAAMEYAVYNPDQPTKEFLLRIATDGSEEVLPADELVEDVEHRELKVHTLEGSGQLDSRHE